MQAHGICIDLCTIAVILSYRNVWLFVILSTLVARAYSDCRRILAFMDHAPMRIMVVIFKIDAKSMLNAVSTGHTP